MKKYLFLIFGLVFTFSCSENTNQEVIKAYIDAHNEHDVEKAMSYYSSNVVFDLKNTWTKEGAGEIRNLEVWDSTINSNLKLEALYSRGDSVFCKIIENNDWFASIGIENLTHDPTVFIVDDHKIKKIIATPSPETGVQIERAIGSIIQWSKQNQDSTIYTLIPNGQFVYSSEAALKWKELFKKWNSSSK